MSKSVEAGDLEPTKTSGVFNEIFGFAISVFLIVFVSWVLWYYFDLSMDGLKGLFVLATGGLAGGIFGFLGEEARNRIKSLIGSALCSASYIKTALSLMFLIILAAASVTRTEISWKSGSPNIFYEGKLLSLDNDDLNISIWSLPFKKRQLVIGEKRIDYVSMPIVLRKIELSEGDVFSGDPDYINISDLLRLSFFQYVENRFLLEAKNAFESERAKKYVALNEIYGILKFCFIEDDIARSGDLLLERFSANYPNSSWINLLKSCLLYGQKRYDEASIVLLDQRNVVTNKMKSTYLFFRGVNNLKYVAKALKPGLGLNEELVRPAITEFQHAEKLLIDEADSYFKRVAVPSSQILQGISYFYAKKLEAAKTRFDLAASASYPGLKARALNALGFVKFTEGDIEGSKSYFSAALNSDNSFPYARTNLAYCYMAEGRYEQALNDFFSIAQDVNIQRESRRDIVLAQIGIAHIQARGLPEEQAILKYSSVMKSLNFFDFSNIDFAPVRLVRIYKSLAERLYGDNRYYGLEIFSFSMYSLAFQQMNKIPKNKRDESYYKLQKEIIDGAVDVRRALQPTWFVFKSPKGFFAPTYEMNDYIVEIGR